MSIVRLHKENRDRWITTSREAADDSKVPYAALGLWYYLMGRPDDWTVRISQLADAHEGATEYQVKKSLKALRDSGYAELRTTRDEKGQLTGKEWVIFEAPQADSNRQGGFADVGESPRSANPRNRGFRPPTNRRNKDIPIEGGSARPREDDDTDKDGQGARIHQISSSCVVGNPQDPDTAAPRPDHAPTLDSVLNRAGMAGVPREEATEFFYHYDAQDWMTGGGKPIKRWQSKMMQWHQRQRRMDQERGGSASHQMSPAEQRRRMLYGT